MSVPPRATLSACGRLADIVLWHPKYFGAKPQLVLKSGFPAYGVTGDPNASTDTCEQVRVDALSGRVTLDGDLIESRPADSVSLSRLYFL